VSPRQRLTDEETSEHARRLIEAAFRVVAATGDTDPSVRPILREAGLSRPAFYRCYGSKDDLMKAVFAEGRKVLADYLASRMARVSTPEAKIRAWVAGMMRQAEVARAAERTRPFVVSLGLRSAPNAAEFPESERLLIAPLTDVIAAGTEEGVWQSPDPPRDARMIHDLVVVTLRRHLILEIPPTPRETQALSDFALRALSLAAPSSSAGAARSPTESSV
jgi:AcrR family transcriptional regulator